MANVEKSGTMKYKDKSGNMTTMYPKTKVANVEGLSAELDKKAPLTHSHTKSQISDFPTSMPASDVKAWAKAATKPSYTASEVGADASGAAAKALTDAKTYTDGKISDSQKLDLPVAASSSDGVAYSATVPGATLTAGYSFIMIPNRVSSSTSTTLNVNGLGAKALRVHVSGYTGTTSAPMTNNWLAPNKPVRVTYDGMWWITDVVLPSAQQLYGNVQAEDVDYSNTSSGLAATKVQAAIDELAGGALRNTSGGIFIAVFGDTTYAEVKAAYDSGKIVFAKRSADITNPLYYLQNYATDQFYFVSIPGTWSDNTFSYALQLNQLLLASNGWSEGDTKYIVDVPEPTQSQDGQFLQGVYDTRRGKSYTDWAAITPASIGAATMTEVNTAIQTAIGDAIGGSY